MPVEISGIHIPITEDIDKYIKNKLEKLNKYFRRVPSVRVILKMEKGRYSTEVNVISHKPAIYGNAVASDLYASVEMAIDKVEKQVKKYKEKIQSRRSRSGLKKITSTSGDMSGYTQPKIVHTTRKILRSMNVNQAALELDLEESVFLVFLNRDTDQVNVIYKRNSGDFGLIEPQL